MTRKWRLMTWMKLAAILAADPYLVFAIASMAKPLARCSSAEARAARSAQASCRDEGSSACRCGRCAECAAGGEAKAATADDARPGGRPCCPGCPSCPIPGGCALCCVGKVPWLASQPDGPAPSLAVAPVLDEAAPLYSPPPQARLRRPPKA